MLNDETFQCCACVMILSDPPPTAPHPQVSSALVVKDNLLEKSILLSLNLFPMTFLNLLLSHDGCLVMLFPGTGW